MKKVALVSLAYAAALAICPGVLFAQQIDFTITGNGIDAYGVLTYTPIAGDPGVYGITGITGTYSDSNGSNPIVDGVITSLYYNPTFSQIYGTNPTYLFTDDNLLYLGGNGGLQLDNWGMVFDVNGPLNASGGTEVGICGSGCATGGFPYNENSDTYVLANSGYTYQDAGNNGVGVQFLAPEGGGSLLYALIAGATCFGAILFVSRDKGANLAAS